MKKFILYCTLTVTTNVAQALENFGLSELMSLSLEDLADIRVSTGGLTNSTSATSASAITIIRQEQIELSAAKNLANLLEQHVPGLVLMEHSEGSKIGIRGLIAAENYKLLILVNGKNITNMVYEGVITELDLWDLNDLERVEVIRGPGSVTYGTGAIAGVINLITKTPKSNTPAVSVSLMNNYTYQSTGINMQHRKQMDNLGMYSFLSIRETNGLNEPKYFQISTNETSDTRYIGYRDTDTLGPQSYLADSHGRPQLIGHLGVTIGEHTNLWTRYTQSGQTHNFSTVTTLSDGTTVNSNQLGLRSFMTVAEHSFLLDTTSKLDTSVTYSNQEYIRYRLQNPSYPEDSIRNIRQYAFSQERTMASAIYNLELEDKFNLILGYEYNRIGVHAPWGKNDDHIWIYEGVDLISDIDTTVYIDDSDPALNGEANPTNALEINSGLIFETHTQLMEAAYHFSEHIDLMYAHRIDISDVSDPMYSPRMALTTKIDNHNVSVFTIQRALRMMPLRAQYIAHLNKDDSEHESIDSIEASLTNTSLDNTMVNIRSYFNRIKAVGFTGMDLQFLGDMDLFGIELEGRYKTRDFELSLNHSYLNLLTMHMNQSLKDGTNRNNISFADYYYVTSNVGGTQIPLELQSTGNGLNNWSTNSSKVLLTNKFMDERLRTHLNAQIYWDYDGAYDEMKMYQAAYNAVNTDNLSDPDLTIFNQQKSQFEYERALLEKENAYKYDISLNGSIAFDWQKDKDYELSVSIYMDNILSTKKRYYVSTGSSTSIPNRLKYLEEPRSIGISLKLNFK